MPRKIILDCDPGHDDAVALLLAAGSPEIDLLLVTTVVGNQTLAKVTNNARSISEVFGLNAVPIAAGCVRPLVRDIVVAAAIHGESGLDGVDLPTPAGRLEDTHAVDLIIDTVMTHEPKTVTLVATGGLTNIAMAVRKEPRLADHVQEVVLMGGGYHKGNRTAVSEFNISIDPEAAHIVFNEPWPLVMIGLDLTHQALATPEVVERIRAVGTNPATFIVELLAFFTKTYKETAGFDAPPVHDPCAIAYLIDPTVVQTQPVPVDIEMSGNLTTGMTVADFRYPPDPDCSTSVGVTLDHGKFWDLVIDALERVGTPGT